MIRKSNALGPVVVGGNGHSGTRIFIDVLAAAGCFTGVTHVTKRKASRDLKVIDLLNRWVEPYVYDRLDTSGLEEMKKAFAKRLRLYFPLRSRPWGFKNPRTLMILPFLDSLLPNLRFVHVVRDGRDISLGNPFVGNNRYVDAFLAPEEKVLPVEEKMILFWGRSNEKAMRYGRETMADRYKLMRWEDICFSPDKMTEQLLTFAKVPHTRSASAAQLVERPKSIGRWKNYPSELRSKVESRGAYWLSLFGYT